MTDREKIMSPDYLEILSDFTLIKGLENPIRDYVSTDAGRAGGEACF